MESSSTSSAEFGPQPEGFEGIDYPASVAPLRSIGPDKDIINLVDEPSDDTGDDLNEEADAKVEEEEIEDREETPVASSSRAEGTGNVGESSSKLPKRKRKIVALDPDEIPIRTGRDPCPY
ncbi:hypothetical protein RHMOL_Rhmol07G0217900 [Rhododendron molle]|uniref:Uncharacterized protein n=1 Tax=Rhododendron molle TaxID=49168 RepID=A0ACC0N3N2_RHOML|nr:hypothetical protein RHMOL_Rhmol07G0217900 [Rhododendron molle]